MKRSELAFTLLLIPVDFFAIIAAAGAAFALRFHPYFTAMRPVIFDLKLENFLMVAVPISVLWIFVFAFAGLYKTRRVHIASEFSRIILASSTSMAIVFAVTFFSRTLFDSRFLALASWLLAIAFVVIARLVIRGLQLTLLNFGVGTHRIMVIGKNPTAEALIEEFKHKRRLGYQVVGHYKSFDSALAKRLIEMAKGDQLDEVVLADPEASRGTRLSLIALTESEHLGFLYTADLFAAVVGRAINHTYAGVPVIEVQKTPLDGWGAIYKRLFDIVGSVVLIVLTSPFMLLTALAIKLDSRGPILFSKIDKSMPSVRIGQNGKPFRYFKFRSMIPGTHFMRYHELSNQDIRKGTPMVKIKNDPRVTHIGKFMRKFSIDELPEFFLVLSGKMSLVGPRPHLPEEVDHYQPEHKKVHTVKPGMTGMAQISGRANLNFEDEVRLDTYYIEHWSPLLDLYILLKTPLVVLFRKERGSY
jgi:exopolysaccharide biosynthesis polyprenyl glycosylphosphotransferase